MDIRIRVVGQSRFLRATRYEVEVRASAQVEWASRGIVGSYGADVALGAALSDNREGSSAKAWAIEAYKRGDNRWVYPNFGACDAPPI